LIAKARCVQGRGGSLLLLALAHSYQL